MDNGTLALLIPVLAISIGLVAVISSHIQKMAKLKIEEARTRLAEGGGDLQILTQEVDQMRQELAEVQERLDFTERLLSQKGAAGKLGGGEGT